MIVKKRPLGLDELPIVIENSFPKLNTSNLLLTFLENKNKLRSSLNEVSQPETFTKSDLEKNVLDVLENSTVQRQSSEEEEIQTDEESIKDVSDVPGQSDDDNDEEEEEPSKHDDPKHEESARQPSIYDYDEDEEDEEKDTREQQEEERSDILWSLKKLKKHYDPKKFPHYDEFTSTSTLKRILKEIKREVILDENVNQTRQWLVMGWWAMEKVGTEYLSIDLSGFTAYETQNMNEYQKVLVEIGERSYLNWSEGFPPELKLLFLMLTHAALFHVKKKATSFTDVLNLFDTRGHGGEMRGPSRIF
jgi:hypothetical protein